MCNGMHSLKATLNCLIASKTPNFTRQSGCLNSTKKLLILFSTKGKMSPPLAGFKRFIIVITASLARVRTLVLEEERKVRRWGIKGERYTSIIRFVAAQVDDRLTSAKALTKVSVPSAAEAGIALTFLFRSMLFRIESPLASRSDLSSPFAFVVLLIRVVIERFSIILESTLYCFMQGRGPRYFTAVAMSTAREVFAEAALRNMSADDPEEGDLPFPDSVPIFSSNQSNFSEDDMRVRDVRAASASVVSAKGGRFSTMPMIM